MASGRLPAIPRSLRTKMQRLGDEIGLTTLRHSSRDVHLLLLTRCVRMFAYGSSTLVLALYFSALGNSDRAIGLFLSLTLVGDVAISLLLTLVADSLGRRRILTAGGILMAISGVVFALSSNYLLLLLAAVVGVISPSGNEIGPFRAVEESTLANLSDAKTRSDIFAFYVVVGTLGGSLGSLTCGWTTQYLQQTWGWTDVASFRLIFWVYAATGLLKAGVTTLLSSRCEAQPAPAPETNDEEDQAFLGPREPAPTPLPPKVAVSRISAATQKTLVKLCGLFFFDSLASGMVPNSLIALYISRKFSIPEGSLGSIIAAAQFLSSIGNIFASSVAKRIGLVRTMVFTHLPSAILLSLVPLPGSLGLTIAFLTLRASLNSMDQAPRSAFLSAIVLPAERTAVMGIVNTVKTASQSSGPLITGLLAGVGTFWVSFVLAGILKGGYDIGLLTMFLHTKLEGEENDRVSTVEAATFELDSESDSGDERSDRR